MVWKIVFKPSSNSGVACKVEVIILNTFGIGYVTRVEVWISFREIEWKMMKISSSNVVDRAGGCRCQAEGLP